MFDTILQLSFIQIIVQGGWVMAPLLACSLAAVSIVIERLIWGPRVSRVIPKDLLAEAFELIHTGNIDEVSVLARSKPSPISRLMLVAIQNSKRPRQELIQVLEMAGKKEAAELNKYLSGLALISAISPLLGLLGTVFGIMRTFNVVGQLGLGNAQHLAAGIGEALITTAGGLCIAIPVVVFYRYFLSRSRYLILEMESICLKVVDAIQGHSNHEGNIASVLGTQKRKAEASPI